MVQRAAARPASPERGSTGVARSAELLERVAACLAIALAVARPLYPSEDAEIGSGLLVVGLWGCAALLWAVAQLARGELRIAFGVPDCLALWLLALIIVSVFWADTPRPAINMACEWAGLVVAYFVVRQLFRDATARRALVAAMLALAVCLSLDGIYQAFWGLELTREEYRRDPINALMEAGIVPGSPQQEAFENRLRSHEPFATFALANSLAGFLVAWLPLMLGWLAARFLSEPAGSLAKPPHAQRNKGPSESRRPHGGRVAVFAMPAAGAFGAFVTLMCLIMTQSRTAYVALLVELLLLATYFGRPLLGAMRGRVRVAWLCGVFTVAALGVGAVIVFAIQRGKLDEKLITQATRSFRFRWEYWRATASLVREFPWTGTGPGNFRGHYLRYKLPESSEEIADPHNMVLEVAATSGVPAAMVLLCFFSVSVWRLARGMGAAREPARPAPVWMLALHWMLWLWLPGVAGWAISSVFAAPDLVSVVISFAVWAAVAALWHGGATDAVDPRVCAAAVLGLGVNLLGAGGIGMPAVAQSLWLLVALGLNAAEAGREPRVLRSPKPAVWLLVGFVIVLFWFVLYVWNPVVSSQTALSRGQQSFQAGDRVAAEVEFVAAIEADPLAFEPWMEMSRIEFQRWATAKNRPLGESRAIEAVDSVEKAIALAPSRLEPKRMRAELLEIWARRAGDADAWRIAAGAYGEAVATYPTSARLRAKRAEALWSAEEREAATAEMREALRLDAITPHVDKKLDAADRERFEFRLREGAPRRSP